MAVSIARHVLSVSEHKPTCRSLSMVVQNVTSWRREHLQWLNDEAFEVGFLQETHVPQQGLDAFKTQLAKAGFHAHVIPSGASSVAHNSGGVAIVVRSHLNAQAGPRFSKAGCGYVSCMIRFRGGTCALFSVYLQSMIGVQAEPNVTILASLAGDLASLACPWLVAGDWNSTPTEIEAAGLCRKLRATLVGGCSPTVDSGGILDFGLASVKAPCQLDYNHDLVAHALPSARCCPPIPAG